MLLRTSRIRPDVFAIGASAVLALGGMYIVRNGDPFGWWILLACSCTAALLLLRPHLPFLEREPDGETLDVTPWGVRRFDQAGLHEAVSWSDLSEVSVVTMNDGPDVEDVHVLLRGRANTGVLIPHTMAVESGVLTELELRLPDFDNAAFIDAMTSTKDGVFVLWRAPRPIAKTDAVQHRPAVKLRAAS